MSADVSAVGLRYHSRPEVTLSVDTAPPPRSRMVGVWWSRLWPKLMALGIVLALWQLLVWSQWKPEYVLPSPAQTFSDLFAYFGDARFWNAVATTLRRALIGFALAVTVGTLIGIAVSRFRPLRAAIGSLITGLQTMPSIAWFPLALLVFGFSEAAIMFVVILGAAPSVANGIVSGVDHVSPSLVRAARSMGAGGLVLYRLVILPAALPAYVSGLKQGWAFAWRSLMAGELLVIIAQKPSLGLLLDSNRQLSDAAGLVAIMIVVLVLGMIADSAFGAVDTRLRRSRGLTGAND